MMSNYIVLIKKIYVEEIKNEKKEISYNNDRYNDSNNI